MFWLLFYYPHYYSVLQEGPQGANSHGRFDICFVPDALIAGLKPAALGLQDGSTDHQNMAALLENKAHTHKKNTHTPSM